MSSTLNPTDLRQLALRGAQARLEELRQEQAALLSAFPDLGSGHGVARVAAVTSKAIASNGTAKPRQKYNMSAAQKLEVSLRMKKYWAARRREKATAAAK